MDSQLTYYTMKFDMINDTYIYRTGTHGFLTTSGEDTDGLILHNLTVTKEKISGYFECNQKFQEKVNICLITRDGRIKYHMGLKEINGAFCFDIDDEYSDFYIDILKAKDNEVAFKIDFYFYIPEYDYGR